MQASIDLAIRSPHGPRFFSRRGVALHHRAPHLEHSGRFNTLARVAPQPAIRADVSGLASRWSPQHRTSVRGSTGRHGRTAWQLEKVFAAASRTSIAANRGLLLRRNLHKFSLQKQYVPQYNQESNTGMLTWSFSSLTFWVS